MPIRRTFLPLAAPASASIALSDSAAPSARRRTALRRAASIRLRPIHLHRLAGTTRPQTRTRQRPGRRPRHRPRREARRELAQSRRILGTQRTLMNLKSQLSIFLLGAIAVTLTFASAQQATQQPSAAAVLPSFAVATIKPVDPAHGGAMGFYSRPGGRVFLGFANAKTIISYAFDVQGFQIAGGPEWVSTDRYNIEAIPPDSAQSRTAKQPPLAATPSSEQRLMLQSLLRDRFGLRYHRETREGAVYILTRGSGKLQRQET